MNDLLNKFLGMNAETRERTIAAIVIYVLNFLVVFHIIEFSSEQIEAVAQIVAIAAVGIAWVISHYKNNDYTEEGCIGTGVTRQLKREKEEGYVGDTFYTEEEEVYEGADLGLELEEDAEVEIDEEDSMPESNIEAGERDA